MKQRASVERCDGYVLLSTPYHSGFVSALKVEIIPELRSWDPDLRIWRIEEPYVVEAIALASRYFEVTGTDNRSSQGKREQWRQRQQQQQHSPASSESSPWQRAMFSDLPEELHERAFKALMKVVHPDHGGVGVIAQQLNVAYDMKVGGGQHADYWTPDLTPWQRQKLEVFAEVWGQGSTPTMWSPGYYTVRISEARPVRLSSGEQALRLYFEQLDGPMLIPDVIPIDKADRESLFYQVAFLQAVGIPTPSRRIRVDTKRLPGKILEVSVEQAGNNFLVESYFKAAS